MKRLLLGLGILAAVLAVTAFAWASRHGGSAGGCPPCPWCP